MGVPVNLSSEEDSDVSFESAPGDLDACARSPDAQRRNLADDLCRSPEEAQDLGSPEPELAAPVFVNDLLLHGPPSPASAAMTESDPDEPTHHVSLFPNDKGPPGDGGGQSSPAPATTADHSGEDSAADAVREAMASRASRVQARAQELSVASESAAGKGLPSPLKEVSSPGRDEALVVTTGKANKQQQAAAAAAEVPVPATEDSGATPLW